jgi:CRP/FNR family transcriptional regulator, anaerobic regulatory protein
MFTQSANTLAAQSSASTQVQVLRGKATAPLAHGSTSPHVQILRGTTAIAPLANRSNIVSKCSDCNMRKLCLPTGMSSAEQQQLDSLVANHKRITRGETLFRENDNFEFLYVIRSGFFKTSVLIEDGRDQVTGFHMAGDMLGLDGIGSGVHNCDAVALEDAEVCIISFRQYERLSHSIESLHAHLYKLMSHEIARDHNMMLLLGTMRAEERLAAFLLNLSERFSARGYSPREFILRMTREEIGSYLGLKLETVSRMFSKFHDDGLVSAQQKHIHIMDVAKLRRVIGNCH